MTRWEWNAGVRGLFSRIASLSSRYNSMGAKKGAIQDLVLTGTSDNFTKQNNSFIFVCSTPCYSLKKIIFKLYYVYIFASRLFNLISIWRKNNTTFLIITWLIQYSTGQWFWVLSLLFLLSFLCFFRFNGSFVHHKTKWLQKASSIKSSHKIQSFCQITLNHRTLNDWS